MNATYWRGWVVMAGAALVLMAFATGISAQAQPGNPNPGLVPAARPQGYWAEMEKLEKAVSDNSEDLKSRMRLLRLYVTQGLRTVGVPKTIEARRRHILWLVEHHPEAAELATADASIVPKGNLLADLEGYDKASQLWIEQASKPDAKRVVIVNAVAFFEVADRPAALRILATGLTRFPDDPVLTIEKGKLLVFEMLASTAVSRYGEIASVDLKLQDADAARAALKELEDSNNADLLGGAGALLVHQMAAYIPNGPLGKGDFSALGEKWLKKALELKPSDAEWRQNLMQLYQMRGAGERDPKRRVVVYREADKLASTDDLRLDLYPHMVEAEALAGEAGAEARARILLALAEANPKHGNHEPAVHYANVVLGLVALRRDDVDAAKQYLLASARVKGSATLSSYGPSMKLAQELLGGGEKNVVVEYLELCRAFWSFDRGRIDFYERSIREGLTPDLRAFPRPGDSAPLGKVAPDFRLPSLDGKTYSYADYRGKAVVLDFWATWCVPCRQQMPALDRLAKEYASKGVAFFAVNVGESDDVVSDFLKKNPGAFTTLMGHDDPMLHAYSVYAYPTVVAIGTDGKVADYVVGGVGEARLRQAFEKSIAH